MISTLFSYPRPIMYNSAYLSLYNYPLLLVNHCIILPMLLYLPIL